MESLYIDRSQSVCQPLHGKLLFTLILQGAREDGAVDMDRVGEDAQVRVKHMD